MSRYVGPIGLVFIADKVKDVDPGEAEETIKWAGRDILSNVTVKFTETDRMKIIVYTECDIHSYFSDIRGVVEKSLRALAGDGRDPADPRDAWPVIEVITMQLEEISDKAVATVVRSILDLRDRMIKELEDTKKRRDNTTYRDEFEHLAVKYKVLEDNLLGIEATMRMLWAEHCDE